MPVEFTGGAGKIADTLNDILELSQRAAEEVEKIATVVGKEGKLNQARADPRRRRSVGRHRRVRELARQRPSCSRPTKISRVIGAVARGDLSPDDGHRVRWASAEG